MIALRLPFFLSHRLLTLCTLLMFGALLCAALLLVAILFLRPILLTRIHYPPLARILTQSCQVITFVFTNKRTVLICLLLSLTNMTLLTIACICFAHSLYIPLPPSDYFTMFPIITILTAIPLTPGAMGIREGLFAELFKLLGIATFRTIPLSLLVYLGGVIWSLFGGLLYLFLPDK